MNRPDVRSFYHPDLADHRNKAAFQRQKCFFPGYNLHMSGILAENKEASMIIPGWFLVQCRSYLSHRYFRNYPD